LFVLSAVSVSEMPVFSNAVLVRVSLGMSTLSGMLLLAPWARSGRTGRSMFALISSASALDLISGVEKAIVVMAVVAVLVAVGTALVAAAWSRPRLAAVALVAPGPILVVAAMIISKASLSLDWGAFAGSTAGVIGSICATMSLLIDSRQRDLRK